MNIYKARRNIMKTTLKSLVLSMCLLFAGCSTIPYPELPGLRILTGDVLTKEEQKKVLTDMKKDQADHQEARKEVVVDQTDGNNNTQQNVKPAVVQ